MDERYREWTFAAMILVVAGMLIFSSLKPAITGYSIDENNIDNTTIGINLEYRSGSVYDSNNDGQESTQSAIDFTVENTEFDFDADESKLCTKWQIHSNDDGSGTLVCHGSIQCCAFIDLEPLAENWDDPYYSVFGKDNAGFSNIVSAQVLYVDYSTDLENAYSQVYNSEWSNLESHFYLESVNFENVCVDTCLLDLNLSNYTLIFDIEDALLNIDMFTYVVGHQLPNVKLSLSIVDDKGDNSGSFKIYKNDIIVENTLVKPDYYNIEINPTISEVEKLVVYGANITEPVNAKIGIDKIAKSVDIENAKIVKKYAVDLSQLGFDYATLTSKSDGNALYKCAQWHFESETCFGSWEKIKSLAIGERYDIELSANDPAFAEVIENETIINVSGLYLFNEIPNITIIQGFNASINLSSYFSETSGIIFGAYAMSSINHSFVNEIATFVPVGNFTGSQFTFITAEKGGISVVSNVFNINVSDSNDTITPTLKTRKKDFKLDENPNFELEFISKEQLTRKGEWKEEYEVFEEKTNKTKQELKELRKQLNHKDKKKGKWQTQNETIEAFVSDDLGNQKNIDFSVERLRDGKFEIKIEKPRSFKAGKYTIKIQLIKDGQNYNLQQDFTWGVLALNLNKSIYLENDDAFISIGVLNDEGKIVCDADVSLKITDPFGIETIKSTSDNSILVSPECEFLGVTILPDYYTEYSDLSNGTYLINLTALTSNGERNAVDSFNVTSSVDFDVARSSATRIYPVVPYTMKISVIANKKYSGIINEYVPASFDVINSGGANVTIVNDTKILSWDVNLKKNEKIELSYEYDAPDISPEFYLLGPLNIGDWNEARQWQIANDAPVINKLNITVKGMLVYGEAGAATARYRIWNGTNFSDEFDSGVTVGPINWTVVKGANKADEFIAAMVNASGALLMMSYNGTCWGNGTSCNAPLIVYESSSPSDANELNTTLRAFDVAYENITGRDDQIAIIAFANGSNYPYYRLWNSTNRSLSEIRAINNTYQNGGRIGWIDLVEMTNISAGNNEIALLLRHESQDALSAVIWNSTNMTWGCNRTINLALDTVSESKDFGGAFITGTNSLFIASSTTGTNIITANKTIDRCDWKVSGATASQEIAGVMDVSSDAIGNSTCIALQNPAAADNMNYIYTDGVMTGSTNDASSLASPGFPKQIVACGGFGNGSLAIYNDVTSTKIDYYILNQKSNTWFYPQNYTPSPQVGARWNNILRQFPKEEGVSNKTFLFYNNASTRGSSRLSVALYDANLGQFNDTSSSVYGGLSLETNVSSPSTISFDFGFRTFYAPDTTIPQITLSIDNSEPANQQRVNLTATVSDDTALSFCQFIDNQTLSNGAKTFYNKTVIGTNDECSQNYTIRLTVGNVINFTVVVNDTLNNKKQSEQITTVILAKPIIRTNYTIPTYPRFNQNSTLVINVTDSDNTILSVNFTLISPTGSKVIDNKNGTKGPGDLYNMSYNLTSYGTWLWNVSVYDPDGFIVNTTALQIILMEITETLNPSTASASSNVNVYGHINLSNGSNVSNNQINLFLNEELLNLSNLTKAVVTATIQNASNFALGTAINVTTNSNNITLNKNTTNQYPNQTGNFTSQIIDTNSIYTNFTQISWNQELPYQAEIGRGFGDSNNSAFPYLNTSGLVLLLHFNNETNFGENDTNATDFSIYANPERGSSPYNNGSLKSGAHYNKSNVKFGSSALTFDGVDDIVRIPDSASLQMPRITLTAWIYLNSLANVPVFIDKRRSGSLDSYIFGEDWITNGQLQFCVEPSGGAVCLASTNSPLSTNEWIFVAATWDGTTMKVYKNGVQDPTTAAQANTLDFDTYPVILGAQDQSGTLQDFFNGVMDEVTIWNRSLSDKEIRTMYLRGALSLNLSVRSCDDSSCSGEAFSEVLTNSSGIKLNESITPNNRYFQYKAVLNTQDVNYTPALYNVTINYTTIATDSYGNYNFTLIAPSTDGSYSIKVNATDVSGISGEQLATLTVSAAPIINGTLNKSLSSIYINDVINATFNATDETALSNGTIIINDTGIKRYFNFSLSGTAGKFSQNFTISCASGCVVNITGLANDTSGNKKQNETIFTVSDTPPPTINLNYTIPTYPMYNRNVTIAASVSDENNNIKYVNFTITAPNGTIYNLTNGTAVGNLHNASINLTSYGTWKWNVTVYDADGWIINSSSTGQIILMQITENLNASTILISSSISVSGHINLSNGSNVSSTSVNLFLNDGKLFINYSTIENATGFALGTSVNVSINSNNITLRVNASNKYPNQTGLFTSQIIDTRTGTNFTQISWTTELPYQTEIGRAVGDSNNSALPYVNTSGLVLLAYFNNESNTGENSSLARDFSPDVNPERAGSKRNNGTCSGSTCPFFNSTSSKFGKSIETDTSGRYFTFGNDNSLEMDGGDRVTLCAWVIVRSGSGTTRTILSKGDTSYSLQVLAGTNAFVFVIYDSGWVEANADAAASLGTRYFVCGTFDGGTSRLYIDGQQQIDTGTPSSINSDAGINVDIGRNSDTTQPWPGQIDEVAIWNRSLRADEIKNLYKRGILSLNLSVRSCDDSSCAGESWSEALANSSGTKLNTSITPNNRYFQYKTVLNTQDVNYTPALYNVTINYTTIATDSFGNYNFTLTAPSTEGTYTLKVNATDVSGIPGEQLASLLVGTVDSTPPIINGTINKSLSSIYINNVINATFNTTDETALANATIIINDTGVKRYFNFSLSGGTGAFSQNFTISCASGCVVNITGLANDTSGNKKQNETIFTVAASTPSINLNYTIPTYPMYNRNVTFVANVTDADNDILYVNFTLTAPNGTFYNLSAVASINNLYNTSFNLTSYGTWRWNVTAYDSGGFVINSSSTGQIILMQITENMNASTVTPSSLISVSGHINLSNGTNVSKNILNFFINDGRYYPNASTVESSSTQWSSGTAINVTINSNNLTLNKNATNQYPNQTGNFTSQIIDTRAGSNFTFISWVQGGAYQTEIGRATEDSNNSRLPYVNTSGLVFLMYFNNESGFGENNTNATDFSVYANPERSASRQNNGNLQGNAHYNLSNKKLGLGSMDFDGTGDYVDISDESSLKPAAEISFMAWINPRAVSDWSTIFDKGNPNNNGYGFSYEADGEFCVLIKTSGGKMGGDTSISVGLNQWTHAAVTYDSTNINVYINGVKTSLKTDDCGLNTDVGSISHDTSRLQVGIREASSLPFTGAIDEVAIWNRSLRADEIMNIYKRGILSLNFSVRSCDDSACSGETFNQVSVNSSGIKLNESITPINRYFQYKTVFNTIDVNFTPSLHNVTINYATIATDTFGNYNFTLTAPLTNGDYAVKVNATSIGGIPGEQLSTLTVSAVDSTPPIINGTLNKSLNLIYTNNVINATFNTTDETALANGTIIINDTGAKRYFNFSLSGGASQFSQNFTISCSGGCVVNITGLVNDTSGNKKQNETIFTVSDTPPPTINLNYTIPTYPMYNRNVTIVASISDENNNIKYVNFTITAPNGTIYNLTNGTAVGNLHNASINLTSYGTWKWNVTAYDADGWIINSSSTGQIILMQITENLNASSVSASSTIAVSGHINLSNSSNATRNAIDVFLNEEKINANNSIFENATGFASGTAVNLSINANNITLKINGSYQYPNQTGNFTSQIFYAGPIFRNSTQISWTTELPYKAEIGRGSGDSNNSAFPNLNISGLVLLFYFNNESRGDNETNITDYSAYVNPERADSRQNNGSIVANAHYNSSINKFGGKAISLDGSSDWVKVAHSTSIDPTTAWTLSAWIYRDEIGTQQSIIEKYDWSGGFGNYVMRISSSDNIQGQVINGQGFDQCDGTTTISANAWYHLAVTFDSAADTLACYVNGYADNVNTGATNNPPASSLPLRVGARGDDAGTKFDGVIDEVAIWNRTLRADEIKNLYKRGILSLNLSVRSCDDSSCSGESFNQVPSNSSGIKLNESITPNNRYFQYKAVLNTQDVNYTPALYNVTINYTTIATDSYGNYNFTLIAPSTDGSYSIKVNATDVSGISGEQLATLTVSAAPIINGTLNKSLSSIYINDVINATFNATDETALSNGTIIINDTGIKRYFNFSLSGTAGKFSQNFTISCASGCVVNITGLANDTSGNKKQNETIFTVSDTPPPTINLNYTIPTYPMYNRNVTIAASVSDENNNIKYVNFTITAPNGTIYNLTNGTAVGNLHNASINLTSYGTWKWNVTVYDADGWIINSSSTGQIILMQITENLNASTVLISSSISVSGHINLSNGSNVTSRQISAFINEAAINITGFSSGIAASEIENATGFALGTSVNVSINSNNITLRVNASNKYPNQTGLFTSQIIDIGTGTNFTFISWVQEVPYQTEIGRAVGDNNNSALPYINTSGLVGLWHFNNESNFGENSSLARDFSPDVNPERAGSKRNNGTCSGSSCPLFNSTDAKFGKSIETDGSARYFTVGTDNSLEMSGGDRVSACAWAIKRTGTGNRAILSRGDTSYNLQHLDSTNKFTFTIYDDNWRTAEADVAVNLGQRYFVCGTFDGSTVRLYIDGNLQSNTGSASFINNADAFAVDIGRDSDASQYWPGQIDEVSIWNRTLRLDEIRNLYKRGILSLNLSVRSCDDAACTGELWSESLTNNSGIKLNTSITPINRYFQYKTVFNTQDVNYTPALYNVTINYTTIATDSFGNYNFTLIAPSTDGSYSIKVNATDVSGIPGEQLATLTVSAGDSVKPRINASLDDSSPVAGQKVNMTANVSDETALSFCQFIDNQSLSNGAKTFFNKTVAGTNDQCSQNYTIRLSAGNVINFTVIVNDTNGNTNYSSQIITVAGSINSCKRLTVPNFVYNLTSNVNSSGTCFTIAANNVILDCHGYMINYSQSVVGYGINNTAYNYSTIKSCNIVQSTAANSDAYGVYIYKNSTKNQASNNSITTLGASSYGIYLHSESYNNSIFNNNLTTFGGLGHGVYANSFSTNNSIYSNGISLKGSDGFGVYTLSSSGNNYIYSNNITSYTSYAYGLVISSSNNNNIYGNILNMNYTDGYGIHLGSSSYNNIYENIIRVTGIILDSSEGIRLHSNSNNNNVYSNNITTHGDSTIGLDFTSASNNNNVYSNNITMYAFTSEAVDIGSGSVNNSFYSNIITTYGQSAGGIYLASRNNSIYSNIITTYNVSSPAIRVISPNNLIYSNNITTKNISGSYGIKFYSNAANETLYGNSISSLAAAIMLNGSTNTNSRLVYNISFTNDTIVPCTAGCADNYADIILTSNVTDITFLNVSFNKSRIMIIPSSPDSPVETNNATFQWYLDVNVTNSTNNNPIANAQVNINNSFGRNVFSGLTSITGGITQQIITEFEINGSSFNSTKFFTSDTCNGINNYNITCYTPYNISVNISGYYNNDTSKVINRSKFVNISMTIINLVDSTPPVINGTLNKSISAIYINDVINATFNATDETALANGTIIINDTGVKRYFNFSLSGGTGTFSQNFTISCASGCVVNITGLVNDTSGNKKQNETIFTVGNRAPTITVNNASGFSVDPIEGGVSKILLSFNITDLDSIHEINATKSIVNLTLGTPGFSQFRFNISDSGNEVGTCLNHSVGIIVVVNCTLSMQYYDNASSSWRINISVMDTNGAVGRNDTLTFTYNELSAISLVGSFINFSTANLGESNVPAGPRILLNNTGNDDFDQINISAMALIGVTIPSESIPVTSFFANMTNNTLGNGVALAASAVTLRDSTGTGIANATLVHGHTSAYAPNADKGNLSIFFWVDVPSSGLSGQEYNGTWNITVVDAP